MLNQQQELQFCKARRAAIARELAGHIEDRKEAWNASGLSPEEAEAKAIAAMGDPAQVGREMAKQYPRGWNVVTGVSLVLCAFVLFSALSGSDNRRMIGYAWDSLVYRVFPPGPETVRGRGRTARLGVSQSMSGGDGGTQSPEPLGGQGVRRLIHNICENFPG